MLNNKGSNRRVVFGGTLTEIRKSFGYTQEYVASKIYVSRACYSSWEKNLYSIPLDKIILLAKVYDLDPLEFIKNILRNDGSNDGMSKSRFEVLKRELQEIKTILKNLK